MKLTECEKNRNSSRRKGEGKTREKPNGQPFIFLHTISVGDLGLEFGTGGVGGVRGIVS